MLSDGQSSPNEAGQPTNHSHSHNQTSTPPSDPELDLPISSNALLPTNQEHASPTPTASPAGQVLSALNARGVVPCSFAQAKETVRFGFVDNSTCKALLNGLKVTGAQNAKVSTKLTIIAMKMTQRQFSLSDAIGLLQHIENDEESTTHFLQQLLPSAVKMDKTSSGMEKVIWLRGYAPVFDEGEIKIGEPPLQSAVNTVSREPDFEASEYCRLLHTIGDARMTSARSQLMKPKTRDELDREPVDPWTESIAPLFNDLSFKPQPVSSVAGGVTRADVASIDPTNRLYVRPAGVLKRKFGEFKSCYGTALSKYESSGQGDPEKFVYFANAKSYIMYAFCFLKANPFLQPLTTRTLSDGAQREEGVGDGVTPDIDTSYGYGRKRKRDKQEISIVGMESLSSVLRPFSDEVARATEEAERDKMKHEATEAKARSTQSLLAAIKEAKGMSNSAANEQEKAFYQGIAEKLMANLQTNMD